MQSYLEPTGTATRVLLVDDEPAMLQLFTRILTMHGYQVSTASTGAEALHTVMTQRPDVVVLDISLPDMDGYEVCRRIKEEPALADTFVLVFSGAATSSAATVRGLETGADDYVLKGVDSREFLARLRTVVRLRDTTAALRQREQHYRGLVEILPDAVLTMDLEFRITSLNSQALTMLCCSDEKELMGKCFVHLVQASDQERVLAELGVALQRGAMRGGEYRMLRSGGHAFPIDLSVAVTRDKAGEPSGVVVVVRDNTERKRTEQLLRDRADFNRRIVSTAMDGFWMLDMDGRLLDVNDAYCAMIGYSKGELLTMNSTGLEAPNQPAAARIETKRIVQKGTDRFESSHRRKDGAVIDVEVSAAYTQSGDGFVFVFLRDITQSKRAQQKLSDALELNQSIIAASSVGILALQQSGACVFLNEAAARMLAVEMPEPPDFRTFLAWKKAGLDFMTQCALKTGRVQNGEVRYEASGKELLLDCHVDCFDANGEKHLLVMMSDITQRRNAEEQLKALPGRIMQAQEAERLRVSRELHDGVNQTIASAKMRLHSVLEDGSSSLGAASKEILRRCERLIVQALEENRRIAHDLRPTELDELGFESACRYFIDHFRSRTKMDVACIIPDFPDRLEPSVELGLFRILQEALNNAHKHASAARVDVHLARQPDCVILTIRDNGRGFDVASALNGKSRRRGHGLGLLGMKERTVLLGGDLHFDSAPNRGTTISVTVPCRAEHTSSSTPRV